MSVHNIGMRRRLTGAGLLVLMTADLQPAQFILKARYDGLELA